MINGRLNESGNSLEKAMDMLIAMDDAATTFCSMVLDELEAVAPGAKSRVISRLQAMENDLSDGGPDGINTPLHTALSRIRRSVEFVD